MGVPYVKSFGGVIDQPPLGFYVEGLFFRIFGLSENTGVTLVTFFGLASVMLVYLLGRELYGKSTGFVAVAIFGLNPWQLVLSRSFLIDSQCLFFSILCLYLGILAVRKGSLKFALFTGVVFAAALLTKFYAAFILIPLILFYIYSRPKALKKLLGQIAAFSMPVLLGAFFWYQIVRGVSILTIFHHQDLLDVIPASTGVVASPFFVINFLLNYGLGLFVVAAATFSLLLGFTLKKYFLKTVIVEAILLTSIAFILCVNVILGAGLNLNVPYFSAIKYDYQALPFLVLLAASLTTKGFLMVKSAESTAKPKKLVLYLAAILAVILIAASLMSSMYSTNVLSTRDYLQYRVEPRVDYGYALLNPTPITAVSELMALQYLGFAAVWSGLLWASRDPFRWLLKRAADFSASKEQKLENC
jgi:4-amino-4-deoxy-L-arabinose transferase-like glycosyltransferase